MVLWSEGLGSSLPGKSPKSTCMKTNIRASSLTERPVRVLIVDDSAFMRKSLSAMLESDPRIQVTGVARNGEEALHQTSELHPDVITMDVEMPGMNGIEAFG